MSFNKRIMHFVIGMINHGIGLKRRNKEKRQISSRAEMVLVTP